MAYICIWKNANIALACLWDHWIMHNVIKQKGIGWSVIFETALYIKLSFFFCLPPLPNSLSPLRYVICIYNYCKQLFFILEMQSGSLSYVLFREKSCSRFCQQDGLFKFLGNNLLSGAIIISKLIFVDVIAALFPVLLINSIFWISHYLHLFSSVLSYWLGLSHTLQVLKGSLPCLFVISDMNHIVKTIILRYFYCLQQ